MPNMPKSILVEPLEPLNIEEFRFWLRILEEYSIFIAASPYILVLDLSMKHRVMGL